MFSARWLYSIYTNKYRYKGKYTSFYASRIHLPGCCMAAPPSCCSISISTSFFTFLLTVNILLLCCLFCLYRLCSARCFLCNISTLQQRAKTLTLTFTFSFCCVLFPAFLLHDANWLLGCRSSAVLCSAVQCSALPPSPLILDSAYLQQHWESDTASVSASVSAPVSASSSTSKSCVASGVARTQKDPEREPESVSDNMKKTTLAIVIN